GRLHVKYSTMNNVLAGWRAPTEFLPHLVFALAGAAEADDKNFAARWAKYSEAYAKIQTQEEGTARPLSRTHRLRFGDSTPAVLRIGLLEYGCWAESQGEHGATGVVPELLELMCGPLGITCEFTVLPLHRLVEEVASGNVDVAAGYICRTPSRTLRTVFVHLRSPTEIGIQAI